MYAERSQHEWTSSHIIPYLENNYPRDMAGLRAWLRQTLGVEIPVALLAGDVRATGKNGGVRISSFFSTSSAFEDLVGAVSKGEDLMKTRLQFARDLHYAEAYDTANAIIDTMLTAHPGHADAMTLSADILEHQERHEEALKIALQVLGGNPDHEGATMVAADAYEGLKQWGHLRTMASRLLGQQEKGRRRRRLQQRALACIELGDFAAAEVDISELEADKRPIQRMIEPLKARLQQRRNECGQ
jgi:tetratricopeptide (TPR) repeat protein